MSNPRVFVTSDIGGFDKDDDQSMVHLLLYGDKLDIEGIGSSAPGAGRANDIQQVIDAYARDFAKLQSYSSDYPTPAALRDIVSQGAVNLAPAGGIASPTETSQAIISAARAGSPGDPLYVLSWGSVGDVAQALHDAPDIADKIRMISIGVDAQDPNAHQYLQDNWQGKVWWIDNETSFRGMFVAADGDNTPLPGWIEPNAAGHGALGDFLLAHSTDLYGAGDGNASANGLKMGDTPSLLYLLDRANNDDPTADSWGGDFVQRGTNYWTDNPDPSLKLGNYAGARTVSEDRSAFLADFAARLDRAQSSNGNEAPRPVQTPSTPVPNEGIETPMPTNATIKAGTTELETLSLAGFQVESHSLASAGSWIKTLDSGTASGTFSGAAGSYSLTVGYLDENDGQSPMSVSVNGRVVKSWTASAESSAVESQSVNVTLADGDRIAVNGAASIGELARMDWIRLDPTGAAPATPPALPAAPEAGSGNGNISLGRTELDTLSLSGFELETHSRSSGGEWIKTFGSGQASGVFDGTAGTYRISVGYMDEDDGNAPMSISVNGKVVANWTASANNNQVQTHSLDVALRDGDRISIGGSADGGELARLDWIDVAAAGGGTAAPTPTPSPSPSPVPSQLPAIILQQPAGGGGGGNAALPDSAFDLFAFAGQSNAVGHFYLRPGDNSGGAYGNDIFESEVGKALGGRVEAVNVAISGSGSNQYADGSNYWWDIDGNRPSGLLVDAVNKIRGAEGGGRQLDGLIWSQGEDDARIAFGAGRDLAVDRLTESTQKIFSYIRDQLGDSDLPIFIQQLGSFPNDQPADRYDAIRDAQARIIASDPNTHLGASTTDLRNHNADNVHYSNREYGVIADRLADTVTKVLGGNAGSAPSAGDGRGDQIIVRVSEDAYRGDAQFTVKVDGVQIGGTLTTTASHDANQTQDVILNGDWTAGRHQVTVDFLNDAWGGTAALDRNLYVEDILVNGAAQSNDQAMFENSGAVSFDVLIA